MPQKPAKNVTPCDVGTGSFGWGQGDKSPCAGSGACNPRVCLLAVRILCVLRVHFVCEFHVVALLRVGIRVLIVVFALHVVVHAVRPPFRIHYRARKAFFTPAASLQRIVSSERQRVIQYLAKFLYVPWRRQYRRPKFWTL